VIEPGATAEEVAALVRALLGATAAAGRKLGAVPKLPPLPHIRLDVPLTAKPEPHAAERVAAADATGFNVRSTGVFRPDALPLDIETRRVIEQLRDTPSEFLLSSVSRLEVLGAQLAAERDFGTLTEALAALAGLAADAPDSMVRQASADAITALAVPAAVRGLVAYLATPDLTPGERERAVVATAALRDVALVPLLDAFLASTDADVREACAAVVGRGGDRVVPVLARRLADERREAKVGIAALLGATGSAHALPLLLSLVQQQDASVRAATVTALGRVGGNDAGRAVLAALRDADAAVRAAAAQAAGAMGERSAGPALLSRLEGESEPEVVCALAAALGALRESTSVPRLAVLASPVSGVFQRRAGAVRLAAVRALAAVATPEALGALERYRDDAVPEIRAAALHTLG
jgi:HEAT repeat protein